MFASKNIFTQKQTGKKNWRYSFCKCFYV